MKYSDDCREHFLDGITDAYLYDNENSFLPKPFSMAQILRMDGCQFSESVLHITVSGESFIIADTITVKSSSEAAKNGTVYTFSLSANISDGKENMREINKKLHRKDYLLVLRKVDGSLHLCYTLPNTFSFKTTSNVSQSDLQCSIAINLKSTSDFIPITLKD